MLWQHRQAFSDSSKKVVSKIEPGLDSELTSWFRSSMAGLGAIQYIAWTAEDTMTQRVVRLMYSDVILGLELPSDTIERSCRNISPSIGPVTQFEVILDNAFETPEE